MNRAKKEEKLLDLFKDVPQSQVELIRPLVTNVVFIADTLEGLRKRIDSVGCSEEYQNGANQSGRKISADLTAYDRLTKTLNTLTGQLLKLLPDSDGWDDALYGTDESE